MKLRFFAAFMLMGMCAMAEDVKNDWQLTMTYEGGYSPVKEVQIQIFEQRDGVHYSKHLEYYDETEGPVHREGTVSEEDFSNLMGLLEKNEIWTLKDLKDRVATDGFTYVIEIKTREKSNRFEVYFPELQPDRRYKNIVKAVKSAMGES
ncbi:MAG: hypothetical protein HYS08_02425 [Chlamydiae bacterium]|nr:hypothetical protein [Chlamydiota bacterium]MBI3266731.1 hypothetical protein [Chlamydiota bacterium]